MAFKMDFSTFMRINIQYVHIKECAFMTGDARSRVTNLCFMLLTMNSSALHLSHVCSVTHSINLINIMSQLLLWE